MTKRRVYQSAVAHDVGQSAGAGAGAECRCRDRDRQEGQVVARPERERERVDQGTRQALWLWLWRKRLEWSRGAKALLAGTAPIQGFHHLQLVLLGQNAASILGRFERWSIQDAFAIVCLQGTPCAPCAPCVGAVLSVLSVLPVQLGVALLGREESESHFLWFRPHCR